MDNQEENDPVADQVWDLLKEARPPAPSPFFARNVVRKVRNLEVSASWGERLQHLFRSPLKISGALAAAAILVLGLVTLTPDTDVTFPPVAAVDPTTPPTTFDPASELEAVEYLGQLMAVADPGQLTDEALRDLFF